MHLLCIYGEALDLGTGQKRVNQHSLCFQSAELRQFYVALGIVVFFEAGWLQIHYVAPVASILESCPRQLPRSCGYGYKHMQPCLFPN